MTPWLRQHAQAMAAALRRMGSLNAAVIGVALALPAGAYAVLDSLHALSGRLPLQPQITLFMSPDVKRADVQALESRLRVDARVRSVRFVGREEALKDLASAQGVPELVGALGRNPLPDALVVASRDSGVEALAADFAKYPGVGQAITDATWARRLAALERLSRLSIALLAGLLGAGLVAVTFNTVRLQVMTQRDEIEVSRLLGATDAFIARPFYYVGLFQGLAGGVIALCIVWLGLALLNREVVALAASYGSAFRLLQLDFAHAILVIAAAGTLGWLGAQLSLRRQLREF